jgi:hypothetical protein
MIYTIGAEVPNIGIAPKFVPMSLEKGWSDKSLCILVTNGTETPWPKSMSETIPTERPPLVGEVSANY